MEVHQLPGLIRATRLGIASPEGGLEGLMDPNAGEPDPAKRNQGQQLLYARRREYALVIALSLIQRDAAAYLEGGAFSWKALAGDVVANWRHGDVVAFARNNSELQQTWLKRDLPSTESVADWLGRASRVLPPG